ncbi:hypothetical protein NGUA07_03374 [Salmonella enterica]|nr:hypothetical protein NGUA07_03374 [Salmonella enterica]
MVEFDADALSARSQLPNGTVEIVAAPVGIGDVVTEAAAPRLAAVDAGRNRRRLGMVDDHPVLSAKIAVKPAGVVVDAMIGSEKRRVDLVVGHPPAHVLLPALHLGI